MAQRQQAKQEISQLVSTENLEEALNYFDKIADSASSIRQALNETIALYTDSNSQLNDIESSINAAIAGLQTQRKAIRGNTTETNNQREVLSEQIKAYRSIRKSVRILGDDLTDITELSTKQLTKEIESIKSNRRLVEILAERGEVSQNELEFIDSILGTYQERLTKEKQIQKVIGLTGAAFDNLNRIGQRAFGGLGINLGTLEESFTDVRKAIRAKAEEITNAGEETNLLIAKFQTFGAAVRPLAVGLKEVFLDPLIISKGLTDTLFDLDDASVQLQRSTGQTAKQFSGLNSSLATTVDQMNTVVQLTESFGIQAVAAFSGRTIGAIADLQTGMGLTAEQARGLADAVIATGGQVNGVVDGVYESVNAFNAANTQVIDQKTVLNDVLTTTFGIRASLKGSTQELANASANARRLGLSLEQVDQIANSLLDFESSIQNELEAQLITGRNINLTRARELALVNDLQGLSKELFENTISLAEFSNMNRIQQESIAKSLGISRDELGKIAYFRALEEGLTGEAAANAANITREDATRLSIQQNFQKALQRTLQLLNPILTGINNLLSLPLVAEIFVIGPIAIKSLQLAGSLFKGIFGSVVGGGKKVAELAKNMTGFGDKSKTALKGVNAYFDESVKRWRSFDTGRFVKAPQQIAEASTKAIDKTTSSVEKLGKAQKAAIGTGRQPGRGLRLFMINVARGLNALAGASKAIPVLLSIAAVIASVGVAFAGMGYGIKSAAEGITTLLDKITPANLVNLASLTGHIKSLARSMALLGTVGLLGIPALKAVGSLAGAVGLTSGVVASDTGVAGPSIQRGTGTGVNNTAATVSMANVERKLDKLISVVEEGGDVYLDGYKVGQVLSLTAG